MLTYNNEVLQRIIQELKIQNKKQYELTEFLGLNEKNFGNWKSGLSQSYLKYLHAIADFLDVSVEYLKGETDIKKTSFENEERFNEIYELIKDLSETDIIALKAFIAGLKANRKSNIQSATDALFGIKDIPIKHPTRTMKIAAYGGGVMEHEITATDEEIMQAIEESEDDQFIIKKQD